MKKAIAAILVLVLAAGGAYVELRLHEDARHTSTQSADAASAAFRPAPIRPDWIIEGAPVTEVADVGRTQDETAQVYLWRTTASKFRWVHDADEIVTILQGEVFVTDADGRQRHLKVGDVALFPVGAVQTWDVPGRLVKAAIVKHRMPGPIELAMRWLRRARGLIAGRPQTVG